MRTSRLGRSLLLSVVEGGLATAMGSLFSGVFLIGFALSLGASRLQIGILFTLPSLSAVAQLFGSYWIERGGNCRRICLQMSAVARVLYIPVLLLLLAGERLPAEEKVWLIIAIMAVSDSFSSLSGVAWLSWTKALVPSRIRVPYFGRRNLINTAISFGICLLCGVLVDRVNAACGGKTVGFVVVFIMAMTCGLVGWCLLARIPDARVCTCRKTVLPFRQVLVAPIREANFRRMVSFYTVWNMALNLAAPFIPVFLLQKLGLSVWFVVLLSTINSLAGMAANNFWTRLAQRFGMKPIVLLATLGDAFFPLLLIFVEGNWVWLLLLVHLLGVFNAPISIGPDNFVLKLSPNTNASSYMAVFRAIVGLATALAAAMGGYLAETWSADTAATGIFILGGLKTVFLISFLGRLGSLWLLKGVHEPAASPVADVLVSLVPGWARQSTADAELPHSALEAIASAHDALSGAAAASPPRGASSPPTIFLPSIVPDATE